MVAKLAAAIAELAAQRAASIIVRYCVYTVAVAQPQHAREQGEPAFPPAGHMQSGVPVRARGHARRRALAQVHSIHRVAHVRIRARVRIGEVLQSIAWSIAWSIARIAWSITENRIQWELGRRHAVEAPIDSVTLWRNSTAVAHSLSDEFLRLGDPIARTATASWSRQTLVQHMRS